MKFYDFHLELFPDSDVFDFAGGCIVKNFSDFSSYCKFRESNDFVSGVLLNPSSIKELISRCDKFVKADYLALDCRDYEILRYAVDNALVDAIAHVELGSKKNHPLMVNSGFDHILARLCADRKVSFVVCFRDLLNSNDKDRSSLIARMRQNILLCKKYKSPIIISSGAKRLDEMRSVDNLLAFGEFLGLSSQHAKKALSFVPEKILERKRGGYIRPGVMVV